MNWFHHDDKIEKLLKGELSLTEEDLELDRLNLLLSLEILRELRRLREPHFTLHINQMFSFKHPGGGEGYWYSITKGASMAAITAGQSASFFLSAAASDNSTAVLSAQTLTADDSNVQIAQDTTDATGNTFTVTVPASDTATTFNLSASASVTSNTSATPQTVSATLAVTISPASVPVTFTLSINEK